MKQPSQDQISNIAQTVREEIDALHRYSATPSSLDAAVVRAHALNLLELSCEMGVLTTDTAQRRLHRAAPIRRALTVQEAASRPTALD